MFYSFEVTEMNINQVDRVKSKFTWIFNIPASYVFTNYESTISSDLIAYLHDVAM